ncbi:MAG: response regulator transcription factor [Candidatus Nanopelagicales bacterium]
MTTSVLLIDDHELIRQGLRRAFERTGDFEVIGEAGTIAEATRLLALTNPDVAIFDVRLPDGSGLDAARKAREQSDDLGIVILTMYAGDEQLFEALDAGASAFVPKNSPSEEVVEAARHAASNPRAFSANDLAEAMKRKMSPTGPKLSPREKEVLALLAEGLGVAQISQQLFISESTTKTHISKLYEKLGASNRAQALMSALRMGLLKTENDDIV